MLPLPVRLAASTLLALFLVWAVLLLGPEMDARVESREDIVRVLPRSGLWYHQFIVTARLAPDSAGSSHNVSSRSVVSQNAGDSTPQRLTFRATQAQFDVLRTGTALRLHRLPLTNVAWVVDESVLLGAFRALAAHTVQYQNPKSVPPALGSAPGLARVVAVHRIMPRRRAFGGSTQGQAVDLIVVEFWAQRMRTLVRTVDVVDARSINDLGPGQILQMHYDQRSPRVMRIDDGMRSHVGQATDR